MLPLPVPISEKALINAALQATPELPRPFEFRFLRYTLEHWPEPQLVIHERLPIDQIVVPLVIENLTVCLPKDSCPFAALVQVARSCDFPKSLYQSLAKEDAQLWINNRHRAPFVRDAFRAADSGKYKVLAGGLQGSQSGVVRRWPGVRTLSLPEFRVRDISDGPLSTEVVVHCEGEAFEILHVPLVLRPFLFSQHVRRARSKPRDWHIIVPEASPVLPGAPVHVLLVPAAIYAEESTVCILDVRRVGHVPLLPFVTLRLPRFMVPSVIIARIREALPSLAAIGRIFVDWDLLTRPTQATTSVPVLTLVGGSCRAEKQLVERPPAVLHTYALLSLRTGFGPAFANTAHTLRVVHYVAGSDSDSEADTSGPFPTTTSTTLTAMPANTPSAPEHVLHNPLPGIWTRPFKFFLAGSHNRFVSCVVPGRDDTSQILAFLTWQLRQQGELYAGDTLRSCTRIFFEPDGTPQVFSMMTRPSAPILIWIDARPILSQPFLFRVLRPMSARDVVTLASIPHAATFFLAVNGQPWRGDRRAFARGDVFSLRLSHSGLFNIPINCIAPRFEAIQMLIFDLHGPDAPVTSSVDTLCGRLCPILANRVQLEGFWHQVQCNVERFLNLDQPFSRVTLFAPGLPPIVCSARTRIPPSVEQLQQWWDSGPALVFGNQQWVDLKLLEGDTCLFIAGNALQHRQRAWRLSLTDASDIWWSDDLGDSLSLLPAPYGYTCRPVAVTRELGFCCFLPSDHPPPMVLFPAGETEFSMLAIRPSSISPWNLHWLAESDDSATDDDPLSLPRIAFVPADAHQSSSSTSDTEADAADIAGGEYVQSDGGVSLLQTKTKLVASRIRTLPTPCRARQAPLTASAGPVSAEVWTFDQGLLCISVEASDSTEAVLAKLHAKGADTSQRGLVPLFPPGTCPGKYVLSPVNASTVSVVIGDVHSRLFYPLQLPAGLSGAGACAFLAPFFQNACYCGLPLAEVLHPFEGMLITAAARVAPGMAAVQGCRFRLSLSAAIDPDARASLDDLHGAICLLEGLHSRNPFVAFSPSRISWPHPRLEAAIAQCHGPYALDCLPLGTEAHLFTDGSQNATGAGWGVACTLWVPHVGWCLQGFLGAASVQGCFGEDHHDPCEAEACALTAAFLWTLQLPAWVPVFIGYDCEGAARAADGSWPVPVGQDGRLRHVHAVCRVFFLFS